MNTKNVYTVRNTKRSVSVTAPDVETAKKLARSAPHRLGGKLSVQCEWFDMGGGHGMSWERWMST